MDSLTKPRARQVSVAGYSYPNGGEFHADESNGGSGRTVSNLISPENTFRDLSILDSQFDIGNEQARESLLYNEFLSKIQAICSDHCLVSTKQIYRAAHGNANGN